jgi:hypothetical protein
MEKTLEGKKGERAKKLNTKTRDASKGRRG